MKVSNVKREFHILSKSIKSVNYTARILIGKLDDFGRSQHNTLMVRILTARKNIKIFFSLMKLVDYLAYISYKESEKISFDGIKKIQERKKKSTAFSRLSPYHNEALSCRTNGSSSLRTTL